MTVSNQRVVYMVWQIGESVAFDVALVLIAEQRVGKNADSRGFDQNAGMSKITNPYIVAVILRDSLRRLLREK